MQMAQLTQAYKPEGVSQVQPRGVSMIMSSDAGAVPYGHMMPPMAALQIGSSVSLQLNIYNILIHRKNPKNIYVHHSKFTVH